MLKQFKKGSKGFTLIELLVVIAIIGILSSVVVTSFRSAYARGRDTRRVAEIGSIQNALQLYYDKFSRYPGNLCILTQDTVTTCTPVASDLSGGATREPFLPKIPVDPITNVMYFYQPYANQVQAGQGLANPVATDCNTATVKCQGYQLGADLEESATANALRNDIDHLSTVSTIRGADANSCAGPAVAGKFCYDLIQQ